LSSKLELPVFCAKGRLFGMDQRGLHGAAMARPLGWSLFDEVGVPGRG
jgi:hypothetical protein